LRSLGIDSEKEFDRIPTADATSLAEGVAEYSQPARSFSQFAPLQFNQCIGHALISTIHGMTEDFYPDSAMPDAHNAPTPTRTERLRLKISPQQQGFSSHIGPFYEIKLPSGMRRALALDTRHLNPEGTVHGGVISSFADFTLYRAIGDELGHQLRFATITLNVQFLSAAKSGLWLYGEGLVLRRTRDLIFASGELFTEERPVATMSGIWKLLTQA
jgi:uncharacterized protein (TIGR00369 family)